MQRTKVLVQRLKRLEVIAIRLEAMAIRNKENEERSNTNGGQYGAAVTSR